MACCFLVSYVFPESNQEFELIFPPNAILNASYRGDIKTIHQILSVNPDKDVRDSLGSTALHVAMFQPNIEVVRLLLDYGFDPNAIADKTGYTPLHNAVMANNLAAARLLLQYGANKRIKCLNGRTPLDLARQGQNGPMASLLW